MSHDVQFNAPLTDSIDTPVEISQLDLPLKLEIDTVSMPVAQLSALRAGYVLELPTALPDARIRLVTYGQTIGFGELVSVGDHLGVRLVQLSHSHGSV
jgi:type III secretion protein Q